MLTKKCRRAKHLAQYKRGTNFPNEGFVQFAIEKHFKQEGYIFLKEDLVDLVCQKNTEKWFIEAKGQTESIGVDFNTGLGQILKQMTDPSYTYGIAVPNTDKFLFQVGKVPKRVCHVLNLHWILVNEQGVIQIISPK
jgi:hypothetical protein